MQLKTIATFCTPEDAEVARLVLDDNGIVSFQEGATTVGMVGYFGNAVGWIKLQVPETDAARAHEILSKQLDDGSLGPPRRCPKCGVQVPANFTVCWSCESPIADGENSLFTPPDEDQSASPDPKEDEEIADATAAGDAMAWRAFVAAILSTFLCPPALTFFSCWILLQVSFQEKPLSPKGNKYYYLALGIDLVVCCAVGLFLCRM